MKRSHVGLGFRHELDDRNRGIKQRQPNVLECFEKVAEMKLDGECSCLSCALFVANSK